jgi:hypothetical protein
MFGSFPSFTIPARRVPTMPGSRSGSVWNIMDSEAENLGRRPVPSSLSIICINEKTKKIRISKKVPRGMYVSADHGPNNYKDTKT